MKYDFSKEVDLYMIFDMLGDIVRTGPTLWKINRSRLEDVKNHTFDLALILRILRKYLPPFLNHELMKDYILCHDLAEAITGDITKFQGISEEERKRVTDIANNYLISKYGEILDLDSIIGDFEEQRTIEAKIVHMIDKFHSSVPLLKYQSEREVDMDNPEILSILREHPFVLEKRKEGKGLGDIFYEYHLQSLVITNEECEKFGISRKDADIIVEVIRSYAFSLYQKKQDGTLLAGKDDFPKDAMIYQHTPTTFYES